jgi:serine/threonine-protein kinase
MALDVRRKHSTGAFADRYVARDETSDQDVLVSVVRADLGELSEADRERVMAVVRRYQGLMHPHICAQLGAGFTASDQLWIAQELPEGAPEWEGDDAGTRAPASRGAEILTHVCEGLAYAHGRDLVHGALTPDAVMLDGDRTPKVADFGVGAVLCEAGALADRAGETVSAAPELVEGAEPTPASDVYALGALGVRLMTGPEDEEAELSRSILIERANRVSVGGLASAFGRALEREPDARFHNAEEMLEQLRAVVRPGAPRPARRRRPAREPVRVEPEMSHLKALGLMLWTMLRSLLSLLLGLALISAAVAGGLVLAFRHTPELVVVPRVESKPVAQAVALLQAQELKGKVSRKVYHPETPADHVVSQIPYPGKEVREGRGVELVVSLGPPQVKVPRLVGKPLTEAKDLLAGKGLRLGAVNRQRAKEEADHVLKQSPAEGKEVPIRTEVDLTIAVSAGPTSTRRPAKGPRAADVRIVVPEGPAVQRVRVEVHYPNKRYTVAHDRQHSPGDEFKVHVVAEREASVHTFIDGELVAKQELQPPP